MCDCHVIVNHEEIPHDENGDNLLLVGTQETDWIHVIQSNFPNQAIGIHPWFVKNHQMNDDIKILKDLIIQHKNLRLGEIGLDKVKNKNNFSIFQKFLFIEQMKLAEQFQRSVSIHCVRAYGTLIEILKEFHHIPGIYLHSFNGSYEVMNQLISVSEYLFWCLP